MSNRTVARCFRTGAVPGSLRIKKNSLPLEQFKRFTIFVATALKRKRSFATFATTEGENAKFAPDLDTKIVKDYKNDMKAMPHLTKQKRDLGR